MCSFPVLQGISSTIKNYKMAKFGKFSLSHTEAVLSRAKKTNLTILQCSESFTESFSRTKFNREKSLRNKGSRFSCLPNWSKRDFVRMNWLRRFKIISFQPGNMRVNVWEHWQQIILKYLWTGERAFKLPHVNVSKKKCNFICGLKPIGGHLRVGSKTLESEQIFSIVLFHVVSLVINMSLTSKELDGALKKLLYIVV